MSHLRRLLANLAWLVSIDAPSMVGDIAPETDALRREREEADRNDRTIGQE